MQTVNVPESTENIRRQAIAILQNLSMSAERFELPKPPEALELYRRKLWANEDTGWRPAAEAMLAATQYHRTSREVLSGRLTSSEKERSDLRREAAQRKQRFDAEWSPRGRKYREFREQVQRITFVGRQGFAEYLQPGGKIETAQKAKIEKISSLDEANWVAKEMPDEVMSAAIKGWFRIQKGVHKQCTELLSQVAPLADLPDSVGAPRKSNLTRLAVPVGVLGEEFKHNYSMMAKTVIAAGIMIGGAVGVPNILLTNAIMAALAAPVAIVSAPALIVVAGMGIRGVIKGGVRSAKQELNRRLRELLAHVQGHFFHIDLMSGRFNVVDEYFRTLERTMTDQLEELVRQKFEEVNASVARLTKGPTPNDQQQLAEWDKMGRNIRHVLLQIKSLKEAQTASVSGDAAASEW